MSLDAGVALDLVAAAVRDEGAEHVTSRRRGEPTLIDAVYRALPASADQQERWRGRDVHFLWRSGQLPPDTTFGAVLILRRAQRADAAGLTWGQVLERCYESARSIIALASPLLPEHDRRKLAQRCRNGCTGIATDGGRPRVLAPAQGGHDA